MKCCHKVLSSDSQLPHKNAVNCISPILTLWKWRQQDGSLGACWPAHLGELPWLGSSFKTKAENDGGKHTAWLLVHNHFHHPYTHALIHQHRTNPACLRHASRALPRWQSCSAYKGLSYGLEGSFQVQLCFLNHLSPSKRYFIDFWLTMPPCMEELIHGWLWRITILHLWVGSMFQMPFIYSLGCSSMF